MEKNKNIIWIIIIVLIGIFLLNKYQTQTDMIGIQIHYLKDGQEINTNKLLSLITPPGLEADQVYFTITGRNIGGIDLTNIVITDASPVEFENSLTAITSLQKYAWFNSGDNEDVSLGPGSSSRPAYGQTLYTTQDFIIDVVRLKLWKGAGNPGIINVKIYAVEGGLPTGPVLSSGTINGNGITTNNWYNIKMSTYNLLQGTYAIVLIAPNSDANNRIQWERKGGISYYGQDYIGNVIWSFDYGNSWSKITNADFMFEILGKSGNMSQTLSKGETKTLWISNIMNTSQFESYPQPVRFWIKVSGKDILNNTIFNEDYLDLSIFKSCDDLIINSGITSLGGNLKYCSVYIAPGATLEIDSTIGYLNITAAQNITILGTINGNSKSKNIGGLGGSCLGCSGNNGIGSGGATGGGAGGAGVCFNKGSAGSSGSAASIIGDETGRYNFNMGYGAGGGGGGGRQGCSGGTGGSGGSGGSAGGAGIRLSSPIIKINGVINMDGGNGGSGGNGESAIYNEGAGGGGGGGGGASAGTILIDGNNVDISSSTLSVNGGNGGSGGIGGYSIFGVVNGQSGQQGSGGRIKIFYSSLNNIGVSTSVSGTNIGTVYYQQV